MQLNELKSLLSRFHIRPSHKLGQNFLLSDEILDKIIEASQLTKQDIVLEIGPGLGVLTQRLAEKAGQVIAIEKDHRMVKALRKIFKNTKNVKIVEGDALEYRDPNIRIHPNDPNSGLSGRFKIVANIPYYLTGKLLQKFLSGNGNLKVSATSKNNVAEVFRPPSLIVLLLQKEVAQRIVAKPGDMSLLSVSVQFYSDPEILEFVPRENFYPSPEVDSAIVRLRVLERARFNVDPVRDKPSLKAAAAVPAAGRISNGVDEKKFFQLLKIGFSNKRKQLKNNLKVLVCSVPIHRLLSDIGINPKARAQDLSLKDWEKLYQKLMI